MVPPPPPFSVPTGAVASLPPSFLTLFLSFHLLRSPVCHLKYMEQEEGVVNAGRGGVVIAHPQPRLSGPARARRAMAEPPAIGFASWLEDGPPQPREPARGASAVESGDEDSSSSSSSDSPVFELEPMNYQRFRCWQKSQEAQGMLLS